MKGLSNSESGSATVEVALLLPLYIFLLISLLYLGSFHILNIRMLAAVTYISQKPGSQTVDDLPPDLRQLAITNLVTNPNWASDITAPILNDTISSELFESIDILAMYNEATYSVTGSYSVQGDQIVYSTSVSVTGLGALNEKYQLSDIRDDLTGELDHYCERTATNLEMSLRLPFSSSSSSGNNNSSTTVIDFQSELKGRIFHEHRDVIRKIDNIEAFRRINFLDAGVEGDSTKALDRLLGQTWSPESLNDQFSDFWDSDYIPSDSP